MTAKDAARVIVSLARANVTKDQFQEIVTVIDLLLNQQAKKDTSHVKAEMNELKPEENTIDLQDVDHFELPKEMNVTVEGTGETHKIKIFPDGMSEEELKEAAEAVN